MLAQQRAFIVWLVIIVSFVGSAMALHAYIGEPEFSAGAAERLVEASADHAQVLRATGNVAEAERWNRLVAAAKADLAGR